eukprot:m.326348 g.326348  ORF g.326348 m.326348 type:complete len:787 (+) comp16021_c0_seq6:142-2502(+)
MDSWVLRQGAQSASEGMEPLSDTPGASRPAGAQLSEEEGLTKFTSASIVSHIFACKGAFSACHEEQNGPEGNEWRHRLIHALLSKEFLDFSKTESTMVAVIDEGLEMDFYQLVASLHDQQLLPPKGLLSLVIASALSCGEYDARVRTCIFALATELNIAEAVVVQLEVDVALLYTRLSQARDEAKVKLAREEGSKEERRQRRLKYLKIGVGTVIGGTLLGVTGGLAAPVLAAGLATAFGTGLAALGTTAGVFTIGSLFGAYGAGMGAYRINKRSGAINDFRFVRFGTSHRLQRKWKGLLDLTEDPIAKPDGTSAASQEPTPPSECLGVTICASGWVTDEDDAVRDYVEPFLSLTGNTEAYALAFEYKELLALGTAIENLIQGQIVGTVVSQVIKQTALAAVTAAIAWPTTILKVGKLVDNPWSVCRNRAEKAGKELANALLARAQGNRPVTLIGYSLGSVVMVYCLKELSKRSHAHGIVENVYLFGSPLTADPAFWEPLVPLVANRFVVGHSRKDWLLSFLCRGTSFQRAIAGVGGVKLAAIENLDLSDLINGMGGYRSKMPRILQRAGLRQMVRGSPSSGSNGQRVFVRGFGYGIQRFFGRLGPKPATPLSEVNPAASAAEKVAPDQAAVSQPDQYEEGQIPQASSGAAEGEAMPGKAGNAPAPASEASAQQSRSFFRLKPAVDASQEDVWVGVCFDEAVGDGDGVHQSVRHFQCQPGHGAFFKASTRQVRVMDDITPTGQCYSMLCRNNRVTTCYSPACRAISRLDNTARRYVASQYPQPKAKK